MSLLSSVLWSLKEVGFGGFCGFDWVWRMAGSEELLCLDSIQTQISRKQPLPSLTPCAAPFGSQPVLPAQYCWTWAWCHRGPPHRDSSVNQLFSTQVPKQTRLRPSTFHLLRFLFSEPFRVAPIRDCPLLNVTWWNWRRLLSVHMSLLQGSWFSSTTTWFKQREGGPGVVFGLV